MPSAQPRPSLQHAFTLEWPPTDIDQRLTALAHGDGCCTARGDALAAPIEVRDLPSCALLNGD
ncbi:hypothetical protein [Streptomyces sp. IMTB 2501]|uniref:hypothetical protein n=1 Tax=Streptomyces sp. IMTB 2501 TaxID=1776340 RepID=UPI00117E42B3|nr:hypothetical protein [Streptomyces sp. IMTB 2501]